MHNMALVFDEQRDCWLRFRNAVEVISATRLEEVLPALRRVEDAVERTGLHAAGFLSYEASGAFDAACTTAAADDFPLLWFGLYPPPEAIRLPEAIYPPPLLDWRADLDSTAFARAVGKIKEHIARGETYQVNYTFFLTSEFSCDPLEFFLHLVRGQKAGCAAYVDIGRYVVCSASPELFFDRDEQRLLVRPMKGTAQRGRTFIEDRERAKWLAGSVKNRAENVMILDMVRNDLSRLGGATAVSGLFNVEKYPTVWQMTSTASTPNSSSLSEIFGALYPCASITGAPKYRTMEIIAALEDRPRRIYTGAVGFLQPCGYARFGVAIRTALMDRQRMKAEYGVGAGITWGSDAGEEFSECLDKARILHRPMPEFSLLESLLWTPDKGYFLLTEHLRRLETSAEYFDFPFDLERVKDTLYLTARALDSSPRKVRLLLDGRGEISCEAAEILPPGKTAAPIRLRLAAEPVDSSDPFLYHKTTFRPIHDRANEALITGEDAVLSNERGEITETCSANLVVDLGGELFTPPVEAGLLPGTFRAWLLAEGVIRVRTITISDLVRSRKIFAINSVRRWREAVLVENPIDISSPMARSAS